MATHSLLYIANVDPGVAGGALDWGTGEEGASRVTPRGATDGIPSARTFQRALHKNSSNNSPKQEPRKEHCVSVCMYVCMGMRMCMRASKCMCAEQDM